MKTRKERRSAARWGTTGIGYLAWLWRRVSRSPAAPVETAEVTKTRPVGARRRAVLRRRAALRRQAALRRRVALHRAGGSSPTGGSGGGSTGLRGEGVGQPCETSEDCEDDLNCRVDPPTTLPTSNAPRAASRPRTALSSSATTCASGPTSAPSRATRTPIARRTKCSDFGWCSRSGPGLGSSLLRRHGHALQLALGHRVHPRASVAATTATVAASRRAASTDHLFLRAPRRTAVTGALRRKTAAAPLRPASASSASSLARAKKAAFGRARAAEPRRTAPTCRSPCAPSSQVAASSSELRRRLNQ